MATNPRKYASACAFLAILLLPAAPTATASSPTGTLEATYVGWDQSEAVFDVALAPDGSLYAVGATNSTTFPGRSSVAQPVQERSDIFVIKVNARRTSLDFAVFIPGNWDDGGPAFIALAGDALYITGLTYSSDLPVTNSSYDQTLDHGMDTFVMKLNASTGAVLAATYLGGNTFDDIPCGLAVTAAGNVVVAGDTTSSDFPNTTGAYDRSLSGARDFFVTEFNADLSTLIASTYLGSSYDDERCGGMALGAGGRVYLTGRTDNRFPVTAGAYNTTGPRFPFVTGFVTALTPDLSSVAVSTFTGEISGPDVISIDSEGNVFVSGYAQSTPFVTTPGAYDRTFGGVRDGFVMKFDANLSTLLYSTYLGGGGRDTPLTLEVDADGFAYATGWTDSTDFPLVNSSDQTVESRELYVTVLDPTGSTALYSSYLGGSGGEWAYAAVPDGLGSLVVAGYTDSTDLPGVASGLMPSYAGGDSDGFLAWVFLEDPPVAAFNATPAQGNISTVFAFDASPSSDGQDSPGLLLARWDFDGDGVWDTPWASLTGAASHQYAATGTYRPRLQVRDTWGMSATATGLVVVAEIAPLAAFTATPDTGPTQTNVSFDASGSRDLQSPGGPLEYRWDFDGDGAWDTPWQAGRSVSFSYNALGVFNATLEVRDQRGTTARASHPITIFDGPPVALFSLSPPEGNLSVTFYLDANASFDLEDTKSALQFRVDWDADGVFEDGWRRGWLFGHQYTTVGSHTVVLQVMDTALHIAEARATLGVLNTAPRAALTVSPLVGDLTTRFMADASASSDLESPLEDLRFNFHWHGEGVPETNWLSSPYAEWKYSLPGNYTIRVYVVDFNGLASEAWVTVTVGDTLPNLVAVMTPSEANITATFSLDLSGSSDLETPAGGLGFHVDTNGDGAWDLDWSTATSRSWRYQAPGHYSVIVEARDRVGQIARVTIEVLVRDEGPRAALRADALSAGCPEACPVSARVRLDASASVDLETGLAGLRFRFDFEGDGTWDTPWLSEPVADANLTAPGNYSPLVDVLDSNGSSARATVKLALQREEAPSQGPGSEPTARPESPQAGVMAPDLGGLFVLLFVLAAIGALAVLLRRRRRDE